MPKIVHDPDVGVPSAVEGGVSLDELCRIAAEEMLAIALETERRAYLDAHADVVDGAGHRVVVGNGHLPTREVTTGAGVVEVTAPRVVPYEAELYAVGASLLVGSPEVAIHRHQLTVGRNQTCERTHFDAAQLHRATELLSELADRIASWNPADALNPSFNVDPSWCSSCEFEERCRNHRA